MLAKTNPGGPMASPPTTTRVASSKWNTRSILVALCVAALLVTVRQYSLSIMKMEAIPDAVAELAAVILAETGKDSSSPLHPSPFYHVVFSSSCQPLQNWQSYLFFYSAMKVGQPGNVVS
jgi:hypothetical protein